MTMMMMMMMRGNVRTRTIVLRRLNVAVIGFGTAGAAAATFLARDGGHDVTIFDKTSTSDLEQSNAGAGLGIQVCFFFSLSLIIFFLCFTLRSYQPFTHTANWPSCVAEIGCFR